MKRILWGAELDMILNLGTIHRQFLGIYVLTNITNVKIVVLEKLAIQMW